MRRKLGASRLDLAGLLVGVGNAHAQAPRGAERQGRSHVTHHHCFHV
jgi:hypothetical protein